MSGLSTKQQKALDALLRGCTQEAAAREAGVSRRTLGRWMSRNVAFQQALRSAEQEALKRIQRRLVGLAENACDALGQALRGEAQPAQVRARLMPLRELVEVEERLRALEEKVR